MACLVVGELGGEVGAGGGGNVFTHTLGVLEVDDLCLGCWVAVEQQVLQVRHSWLFERLILLTKHCKGAH